MKNGAIISKDLINQLASGDQKAFRSFFDKAYPLIYRFTHYILPHQEDCREVVSEVFYKVWEQREKLPLINDLKAWLYIITRNEAYHYWKQKEKNHTFSINDLPIELAVDPAANDAGIIEEEMVGVYNQAISELPDRCKLIYLMVREEHLSYKEIAEILSISTGTVEQQMHIAIQKIIAIVRKSYPALGVNK
ncbi:RNA polymerase sigma-70 factor (family 1) [Parabacteroides sp. PFB2-12]|uniref:RNA polymerase sigma factor n=1 Tax=unclassified Parabacteroides TaxID=2649774 RepID=UPI0024745F79|nr:MULTISPECIES: sigma-70 family RNA polymerase sigma factor [unclassified Parabacteroides]MDH6341843.1 RNA polymerase sigma-70 factor (family 1) [Parabacteroides sp. PM6-13]MDH6391618.1 RNA polymerase sigma-70 factor (family 1) [Parabacteroides sp. PFB2-12]